MHTLRLESCRTGELKLDLFWRVFFANRRAALRSWYVEVAAQGEGIWIKDLGLEISGCWGWASVVDVS
jgi:hypothetical protein